MGQLTNYARASALALLAASVFFGDQNAALAAAKKQNAAAPAAPEKPLTDAEQKQKDASASRGNYDAGVKAYQAGKFQPAVDNLSAALRGGGLASSEMSRALYIRGLAYKKQSKPGLAISDLTSALWLKNGLNDADRQSATAERAEAYKLAGLGDGNSGAEVVAVADPNTQASTAAAPPAPAAAPAESKKSKKVAAAVPAPVVAAPAPAAEVSRQSPESEAAKDAARARKIASQQIDENSFQSAAMRNVVSSAPAASASTTESTTKPIDVAAAAPVPEVSPLPARMAAPITSSPAQVNIPAPIPSQTSSQASTPVLAAAPTADAPSEVAQGPAPASPTSSISGFFSDLFGGSGSSGAPSTPDAPKTAMTEPAAPTPVAPAAAAPVAPKPPITTASTSPAPAAAPVKTGKYKLHIAALRSKAEAEAMAQQISKQHGAALNNHAPQVDEAVIGSMGTFYRVRVTGYADANEPRVACNALRTSGFDCLVVTN